MQKNLDRGHEKLKSVANDILLSGVCLPIYDSRYIDLVDRNITCYLDEDQNDEN